jgi:predicted nucleic acid-binding protein
MRLEDEAAAIERLIAKYSDVPMALADACLVRMAEMYSRSFVLTVDGDFRVYRMNGRQMVPTLMPAESR